MIALLQRVKHASVEVNDQCIAKIDQGLLVFVGIETDDSSAMIERLVERIIHYRIFADTDDKMNLSVKDINGGVLLVPQFTLAANTKKGLRPSFASAAPPNIGYQLFSEFVDAAYKLHPKICSGQFGADMQVRLTNDGPVTFWLHS